jgi:hypothetical protein
MSRNGEQAEKVVLVGLALAGAVQMALQPRRTYALLAHGRGWHD